jgi:hypothetical protein
LFRIKIMSYICTHKSGSSSVGRAPAFQAGCREFEPRLPLKAISNEMAFLFDIISLNHTKQKSGTKSAFCCIIFTSFYFISINKPSSVLFTTKIPFEVSALIVASHFLPLNPVLSFTSESN